MESEQPSKPANSLGEVVSHGPSWFATLAGLTYASGFLSEFTFLQAFGIRETAGDFLKARSIHIGILFMLFPISVLLPLVVASQLSRIQSSKGSQNSGTGSGSPAADHKRLFKIPLASFLLYLNMGWIFYLYVLFAPRNFVAHADKETVLPLIFITSVFGPRVIEYIDSDAKRNWTRHLRTALFLLIVLPLDYIALRGLGPHLWHVFWGQPGGLPSGGIYYLVFMLLIPYTLYRANQRARPIPSPQGRLVFRLSGIGLCFIFYFLAIVVFALRVYPFIPASKGGGDYSDSPYVELRGMTNSTSSLFASPNAGPSVTNYFVVIAETSDSLMLADTNASGGPATWREMRLLPNVVQIKRESLLPVTYYQTKESPPPKSP